MAIGASLWHGERITEPFPALRDYPESAGDPAEIAGDAFANQAKSYFNEECEMPMQSTVNGLLLLASFYSGRGKPNLGRKQPACVCAQNPSDLPNRCRHLLRYCGRYQSVAWFESGCTSRFSS